MISISGLYQFTKGCVQKSGAAVGALAAVRAGKRLLHLSGLQGVVNLLSYMASPLAEPIKKVEIVFYNYIKIFTPSISYRSMNHPNFDLDSCGACYSYDWSPPRQTVFCSEDRHWKPVKGIFFPDEPIDRFYRCPLFNRVSLAGVIEETLYRWLLQQKILPFVSSLLPNPLRKVLEHKVTRILLTSLIFAGGHFYYDAMFGTQQLADVSLQFLGGVVFGAIAEKTGSLAIPILAHTLHNVQYLAEKAWGAIY